MVERDLIQRPNNLKKEEHGEMDMPCLGRRKFLQAAALGVGCLAATPALAKLTTRKERYVSFYNQHTGETVRAVYWAPYEGYIRESIAEISYTMRDHRTNEVKAIDPKLLDQMYILQSTLRPRQPVHVISGYRSPATNAMLRLHNKRVAKSSLHMQGMAVDIRMKDRDVAQLYRAALSLEAGGVGYYPRSNFVHIDTGAVRTWR
jgi:uncharacterized protein YcbK (DUF882 family)